jgi:uncharacterized protein (TIGR02246 family)
MSDVSPARTPEDLPRLFAKAWKNGDAAALAALFADDADFVNVVGLWWRRQRAIEKAHAYALARYFKDTVLTLQEAKVRQLGETTAIVHVRWRLEGQSAPDGSEAQLREAIMIMVAERRGDTWCVVAAQNTDVVPGSETNIAGSDGLKPVSYQD